MSQSMTRYLEALVQSRSVLVVLASTLLKCLIGHAGGYSGRGKPPLFGDFEAQRHWMEVTLHVPPKMWYFYDLQYWGLDYPPLTGYHSLLLGFIGSLIRPQWFALGTSRGYESAELTLYMRLTSLLTELVIFVPAAYLLSKRIPESAKEHDFLLLVLLCHPTLAIIDHGHFQYNSAMLGFALWAIYFFYRHNAWICGSIAFCLSLLFKQMALFYALPVFFYLLGRCFAPSIDPDHQGGFVLLLQLGLTVVITMATFLFPILIRSADTSATLLQVVHRIFPVQRGIFEDKVANFWCASNVLIKWRDLLNRDTLLLLSFGLTLLTTLPCAIALLRFPSKKHLLYSLLCGSLSFFLFAFQVHEKSILLPVLPSCLLILDEPTIIPWFVNVAMFSLYPLVKKDGQIVSFLVLLLVWNFVCSLYPRMTGKPTPLIPTPFRYLRNGSYVIMASLFALEEVFMPHRLLPTRYPDLWVVLNVLFCSAAFCFSMVYFSVTLLTLHLKAELRQSHSVTFSAPSTPELSEDTGTLLETNPSNDQRKRKPILME